MPLERTLPGNAAEAVASVHIVPGKGVAVGITVGVIGLWHIGPTITPIGIGHVGLVQEIGNGNIGPTGIIGMIHVGLTDAIGVGHVGMIGTIGSICIIHAVGVAGTAWPPDVKVVGTH
jgi:hypothetical protein